MNFHGGNLDLAENKYKIKKDKIIDFSSNINPLGIPSEIRKLIKKNITNIKNYPEPDHYIALNSLSEYLKIPIDNLIIGNGSIDLIYSLFRIINLNNVLIISPNFSEYEQAGKLNKCNIDFITGIEENNFKINIKDIINFIKKPDIIFLSSPNNPVGYIYKKEELLELSNYCEKSHIYLFIDEAFIDFTENPYELSMINEVKNSQYLFILKSYTKILSIPGLRLGCLSGYKNVIDNLKSNQYPWILNTFAELTAFNIHKMNSFINKTKKYLLSEKEYLLKEISNIKNLKLFNSNANYYLCKINDEILLNDLENYLGKNRILIRNCSNYHGLTDKYFRFAIKSKKENRCLLKHLEIFFQQNII